MINEIIILKFKSANPHDVMRTVGDVHFIQIEKYGDEVILMKLGPVIGLCSFFK